MAVSPTMIGTKSVQIVNFPAIFEIGI